MRSQVAGGVTIAGGLLGVLLAPIMVMVKYLTGWSVVPEPFWIDGVQPALGRLLTFSSPVGLWVIYGRAYTLALLLMLVGLLALVLQIKKVAGRVQPKGLWILMLGLVLVVIGDAIHTATWHQNGLKVPTPGTNPVANTAYAAHMMGMNLVMVGSLATGISALRNRLLSTWLAWFFVLIAPSAVVLSLTLLPTTPSGALAVFSLGMMALGYSLAFGRPSCLAAA